MKSQTQKICQISSDYVPLLQAKSTKRKSASSKSSPAAAKQAKTSADQRQITSFFGRSGGKGSRDSNLDEAKPSRQPIEPLPIVLDEDEPMLPSDAEPSK